MKFAQNAYLANTYRFLKTKFWTCFGTRVPPFRTGVQQPLQLTPEGYCGCWHSYTPSQLEAGWSGLAITGSHDKTYIFLKSFIFLIHRFYHFTLASYFSLVYIFLSIIHLIQCDKQFFSLFMNTHYCLTNFASLLGCQYINTTMAHFSYETIFLCLPV